MHACDEKLTAALARLQAALARAEAGRARRLMIAARTQLARFYLLHAQLLGPRASPSFAAAAGLENDGVRAEQRQKLDQAEAALAAADGIQAALGPAPQGARAAAEQVLGRVFWGSWGKGG